MGKRKNRQSAFTLLELMVVVAIIGVLASIAVPAYQDYLVRARMVEMVLELGHMADRIRYYYAETGFYPDDTHVVPPAEVEMPGYWYLETQLGGNYNWEGPDGYPYAGISILGATAPQRHITMFDKIIDDGDLSTGKFIQTPNGRYTYIISE